MSQPPIFFIHDNTPTVGQPPEDGVLGLVMQGVPIAPQGNVAGIDLYTPKELNSLKDAQDLGFSELNDQQTGVLNYYHISEIYRLNPYAKVWIMLVDNSQAYAWAEMVNVSNPDSAVKLLSAANGKVKILGLVFNPETAYTPTILGGLDVQVVAVIQQAQILAQYQQDQNRPITVFVEGRDFNGLPSNAQNLRDLASHSVACLIGRDFSPMIQGSLGTYGNPHVYKHAAIGTLLGLASALNVAHSIGWVGKCNIIDVPRKQFLELGLSSGQSVVNFQESDYANLQDKGYIYLRKYTDRVGSYFGHSSTCVHSTQNPKDCIELVRVIGKVHRLGYQALLPLVQSPVVLGENGEPSKATLKNVELIALKPIEGMRSSTEISNFEISVGWRRGQGSNSIIYDIPYKILPIGRTDAIEGRLSLTNNIS